MDRLPLEIVRQVLVQVGGQEPDVDVRLLGLHDLTLCARVHSSWSKLARPLIFNRVSRPTLESLKLLARALNNDDRCRGARLGDMVAHLSLKPPGIWPETVSMWEYERAVETIFKFCYKARSLHFFPPVQWELDLPFLSDLRELESLELYAHWAPVSLERGYTPPDTPLPSLKSLELYEVNADTRTLSYLLASPIENLALGINFDGPQDDLAGYTAAVSRVASTVKELTLLFELGGEKQARCWPALLPTFSVLETLTLPITPLAFYLPLFAVLPPSLHHLRIYLNDDITTKDELSAVVGAMLDLVRAAKKDEELPKLVWIETASHGISVTSEWEITEAWVIEETTELKEALEKRGAALDVRLSYW